jgi:ubiquinone/menaquinone biosynthesis C-methylase UbiE
MTIPRRAIRPFLAFNRRLCTWLERWLPQARISPFAWYGDTVASIIADCHPQLIIDAGGGRECSFSTSRPGEGPKIVAVDISESQLRANSDAGSKVVVDLNQGLPLRESSVDLITSSSVLEHLKSLHALFESSSRVLKDGGWFVHVFSCRFAPFALLNQVLPTTVSHGLISFFQPQQQETCGFRAYYRDCYYSKVHSLLSDHGFQIVRLCGTFYQSRYSDFFFPFFALSALYELLVYSLRLKNLSAYLVVVARKGKGSADY